MTGTSHPVGRGSRFVGLALTALLASTALAAVAGPVRVAHAASTCAAEVEPNDAPEQAQPVSGGVCVTGQLRDGDQDLFVWSLSAADAAVGWSIGLNGVPDTVTTVTLFPITSPAGVTPLVVGNQVLAVSSTPTYAPPPRSPEVLLTPGRYLLGISRSGTPSGGTPAALDYGIELRPGLAGPPAGDREPNNDPQHASPVSGAFALSGAIDANIDDYAWTLSAADAAKRWHVELQGQLTEPTVVTLETAHGERLAQAYATPDGLAGLHDLGLGAGKYVIEVGSPGSETHAYRLSATAEPDASGDPEPNDDPAHAIVLDHANLAVHGRISQAGDIDDYHLHVDDRLAAVLLDIKLVWQGGPVRQLCLYDSQAVELGCRSDAGGDTLPNLFLPVGDYTIQVRGDASLGDPYLLRIDPTVAPVPSFETEPNDQAVNASAWDATSVMNGREAPGDVDYFKVTTVGVAQLWRLDVTGEHLSQVRWVKRDGTDLSAADVQLNGRAAALEDIYLVPGDHWFRVDAEGDYSMRLTPQGPPDPHSEREPNNASLDAEPLAIGVPRTGRLSTNNDVDYSRFTLSAAQRVHLTITPPPDGSVTYRLYAGSTEMAGERTADVGVPINADFALDAGDYEILLEPGQISHGRYSMQLDRLDPFAPAAALAATVSLTTATTGVAGYWSAGQQVDATLQLSNTSSADESLTLDSLTSDVGWSVALSATQVSVPAGGSASVPLTIEIPPDAWANVAVRTTVRARDTSGAQQTAFVELTPTASAPPVKPVQAWSVPAPLLGGLNVASLALGGAPVPAYDATEEAQLYDGVTPAGGGFSTSNVTFPVTLTTDLAGDAPVPVVGVILNPQAHDANQNEAPRDVSIELSTDGTTWTPVLTGQMTPLHMDQPFVLPAPVPARFARVVVQSLYQDGTTLSLGEFKVIADPAAAVSGGTINVGAPAAGGHIVWMDPQSDDQTFGDTLLSDDTSARYLTIAAGVRPSWAVGFTADRAALLTRLEWVDPVGSDPALRFTSVDIATSLESPLGPWTSQGTWALTRAADGSVAPLSFVQPVWARYVRYTGNAAKAEIGREEAGQLRLLEASQGASYRSVLGEYGATPNGDYEIQHPPSLALPDYSADPNDTPDAATPLAAGVRAQSTVHTGKDVDWYAVDAAAGQNTLTFTVAGTPTVGVSLVLEDAAGASVPMTFAPGTEPGTVEYTGAVTPGASYRVGVRQPPFSAVFTYDTSGSMGNYLSYVSEALRSFSAGVVPGREAVRIVPFEAQPLIDEWSDDPYALENALEGEIDLSASSSGEASLINASNMLRAREGARAILVVTDAETSSFSQTAALWKTLGQVRPLVFAVHVGANSSAAQSQHLMQDWAGSSDGFYQYASTHGQIDRAFDRMATWLERPAAYSLSFAGSFVKPPPTTGQPGSLSVRGANNGDPSSVPVAGNAAIELILDTSGSMLDRLEGRRRIDVAQSVLTHLVRDKLPPGVPLAFRVFGDTPSSCETRLATPLGPLDANALVSQIQALHVISSVNTPIGAALKQVASDLKGVTGPRIVVLVTDGQENCGGNPAAAVKALAHAGFDVHVNIVGFQIGTKSLRATMAGWAKLGNGSFFNATSSGDLNAAVSQAVSAPFRVFDKDGTVVAAGTVNGTPVKLPPGTYSVEVLSEPKVTFSSVVVAPTGSIVLTLPSSGDAP